MSPSEIEIRERDGRWELALPDKLHWIRPLNIDSQLHQLEGNWVILFLAVWSNTDRALVHDLEALEASGQLAVLVYEERGRLRRLLPDFPTESAINCATLRDGKVRDYLSVTSAAELHKALASP